MGPEQLQEVLAAALNDHGALLWQEQLERQQRVRGTRRRLPPPLRRAEGARGLPVMLCLQDHA